MRIVALVVIAVAACSSHLSEPSPDDSPDADVSVDSYVRRCGSLFAARIVEKAAEADPAFALDCEAPLPADVGTLGTGAMCTAGETANTCRQRLYDTPPPVRTLRTNCTGANCLRGMWLPRCADGSDVCAEAEAVCPDGTRALALVEPANPPSDRWIVYTSGEGGPCAGSSCWPMYRYSRTNADQIFEQSMSSYHPDYQAIGARTGTGIMNGLAMSPLAAFNRVELKRCAEAASDGEQMVPVGDGVPAEWAAGYPAAPVETRHSLVPVWHRGFAIHSALLHALASPSARDLDGNGTPDIPSLSAASQITFAGSSDAAAYYMLVVDALGDIARSIAPTIDVRLIVDGKFDPSIDNEGRYVTGAPAEFSLLTSPYHVTHACGPLPDNHDAIANETCSDANWHPGPAADGRPTWFDTFTGRGSHPDASCVAIHGETAPCFTDMHVIANHLQAPLLVIADQEDPMISEKSAMADASTYHWPRIADYRRRILDQAHDLEQHWASREEPTPATNLALLLRKQRRDTEALGQAAHTHLGQDDRTLRWAMTKCTAPNATPLVTRTTAQVIAGWLDGTLADRIMIEDAAQAGSSYWVTGTSCRVAE